MKIDLCKLFNVEEGEEFGIKLFGAIDKYRFKNGKLEYYDDFINKWVESTISMNHILDSEIIKIPKKKQFTDDELCILRNIKSEINTLGRNINGTIYVTSDYGKSYLKLFNNLFQSLDIGEEIIIDDYVERWRILWINLLSY